MNILSLLQDNARQGKKQLALLIDPDKYFSTSTPKLLEQSVLPDYIFVGGSLLSQDVLQDCLSDIKSKTKVPVVLFPGSVMQVNAQADALLLLSLISGRNPELLIGKHVEAVPYILKAKIETMPTAYMLIDGGGISSVQYMSNTMPIPANKTDIAVLTALAGKMLGLQLLYLDAGSGAQRSVPAKMISTLKQQVGLPIIIGGGIADTATIEDKYKAGADVVVIGNAIESHPNFLAEALAVKERFNE